MGQVVVSRMQVSYKDLQRQVLMSFPAKAWSRSKRFVSQTRNFDFNVSTFISPQDLPLTLVFQNSEISTFSGITCVIVMAELESQILLLQ